jgi:hypothetical protein
MVPYVVRLETGVINRAIYQIAILDDPNVAGPDLQNHADPGWNNRLIYTFGGGAAAATTSRGAGRSRGLARRIRSRRGSPTPALVPTIETTTR